MTQRSFPLAIDALDEQVGSRTRLVEVARTLVATDGAGALTRRALAAAAAVDPWEVSRAFRTRDDLLSALRVSGTV